MLDALFKNLLSAKTGTDVRAFLQSLGDFPKEVVLHQPFGAGFVWMPVGNRTTNVSTIELATHPGRSLVERINNSIDALIDTRLKSGTFSEQPKSPADAARLCFGRPSTAETLTEWFDAISPETEARQVSVVLLDGKSREEPRLDVFDGAGGIPAGDFLKTILGLNVENKIKLLHQLGLFGQGGSSSLGFSAYTLIVSRCVERPDEIAFTVVRRCEISGWKESCYCYLAVTGKDGRASMPTVRTDASAPFPIYPPTGNKSIDAKLPDLQHGTVVRHFDYKLPNLFNALSSSQRNLYHALHYLLFEPLLPFRLTDLREGSLDSRHVAGSRTRLMKLVQKPKEKSDDSRMELKHYRAMEFIAPPGSNDPCIGVEYWVAFSWRKIGSDSYDLRSGTEQFADRDHPILFTYNGQNHGELTGDCLRKIGLNLLRRHMVVHVDVSRADADTKRELFTATRETLRKSTLLDGLTARLTQMLEEDTRLFDLEGELTSRALASAQKSESAELRQRVIDMLRENGLQVGTRIGRRRRPIPGRRVSVGGDRPPMPPIPTLPFPHVSRFDVTRPASETKARIGESKSVWIETDAADEFDKRGLIKIQCEPPLLEVTHKSPLHDGRMKWRLMPASGVNPGEKGRLSITISSPDGGKIAKRVIDFEIAPQRATIENEIVEIPDIEIVGLSPSDASCHAAWRAVWSEIDPTDAKAASAVAYKIFKNGRMVIYYNAEFPVYRAVLEKWKSRPEEVLKAFADEYKLGIALHCVMQSVAVRPDSIDMDLLDKITEQERALVAALCARHADNVVTMRQHVGTPALAE